jgi:hypothetical protein
MQGVGMIAGLNPTDQEQNQREKPKQSKRKTLNGKQIPDWHGY